MRRQTDITSTDASDSPASRDDIILARWFGGEAPDPGGDEVWDRLANGNARGVTAITWTNERDLQAKLLANLKLTLRQLTSGTCNKNTPDDVVFEVSLGGQLYGGGVYFHPSREADGNLLPGAGASAEAWQILTPGRGGESGVDGINRWLQRLFRDRVRRMAQPEKYWERKTCKPLGRQEILYGDKVINIRNGQRDDVYPTKDRPYLANGDSGMVVGQYKGKTWKAKGLPWKAEVEFSSQLGYKYGFHPGDFSEDGDARLELAYALTIHKAQGSEFGITFVVVPEPCVLLSRELLYTALTRQQHAVVILHQGDVRSLMNLSSTEHSEISTTTDESLWRTGASRVCRKVPGRRPHPPYRPRRVGTVKVRSYHRQYSPQFAHHVCLRAEPCALTTGSVRYPDFTIDDAETGQRLYLMNTSACLMSQATDERWDKKRAWYHEHGVREAPERLAPTERRLHH